MNVRHQGRRIALAWGVTLLSALAFVSAAEAADFTVQNTNDAGAGSLRQAVLDANVSTEPDRVLFAPAVTGTITLTSGELQVDHGLDIVGPGAGSLTVSGNDASRIFLLVPDPGQNISISGLRLIDGSDGGGGAIGFQAGPSRLVLSRMEISSSEASSSIGGGIVAEGGVVRIEDSTISGNLAESGGGIGVFQGLLRLENSTVSGNVAVEAAGGGILAAAGVARIENSTISGNSTAPLADPGIGGGILTSGEFEITFESSTIQGNSAGPAGGGLASIFSSEDPVLHNTIIAGNTAAGDPDLTAQPLSSTLSVDASYSLIGSTTGATINETVPGSNILNQTSGLAPLAPNGGLTQTQAITEASLAFDAGDPGDFPPTDQRGIPRPQFSAPDIGAFELQDTLAPTSKLNKKPKKKTKTKKSKAKVTFKFKADEAGATFECKLKGAKAADKQFAPCVSPKSYKLKSKPGKGKKYTFTVKATDANGNAGAPVSAKFNLIRK